MKKKSAYKPGTVPTKGALEAQGQVSFQTVSTQDKSKITKENNKLLVQSSNKKHQSHHHPPPPTPPPQKK